MSHTPAAESTPEYREGFEQALRMIGALGEAQSKSIITRHQFALNRCRCGFETTIPRARTQHIVAQVQIPSLVRQAREHIQG